MGSSEQFNPLRQKEDIPQKSRVIVMLGSRMEDLKDSTKKKFPLFVETQTNVGTSLPGEVSGGWSRMLASVSRYVETVLEAKKAVVLVTGGKEPSGASRSEEAAKELVQRYGLPQDSVHSIGGKGATLGNAAATVEYIESHKDELGNVREIDLVTNDYHMLRAWILFSKGIAERVSGVPLEFSPEDQEKVRKALERGSPEEADWSPEKVRETRAVVTEILTPYFLKANMRIKPVVVEEMLEAEPLATPARQRYAELLRNNKWVRETLTFEYKGIMDLLSGAYRSK